MATRRSVGGAAVAVVGATGAVASTYVNWLAGRAAHDLPLERIYQSEVVSQASSYWNSMAVPMLAAWALGALGALLLSRFILILGWLVGVATLVAWVVMQLRDDSGDAGFGDLQLGVWACAVSLLVMLAGIVAMGRARHGGTGVDASDT